MCSDILGLDIFSPVLRDSYGRMKKEGCTTDGTQPVERRVRHRESRQEFLPGVGSERISRETQRFSEQWLFHREKKGKFLLSDKVHL